jgi:hypothetical protein
VLSCGNAELRADDACEIMRHVNLQIFVAHFFGSVSHACAAAAAAVELQVLRREGERELLKLCSVKRQHHVQSNSHIAVS